MSVKRAYKGFLIYSNLTHDWFVQKDGQVIYCGFSEKECKKQIDLLTALPVAEVQS